MRDEADASFNIAGASAEHAEPLFVFALNALGDRAAAEDCVQATFVRAERNRESYTSEDGSVRKWLFSIMRNLVTDELRARARRLAPAEQETVEWMTASVTEDRLMVERLDLYEALAGLTPEYREVIVAVQLGGETYQQLSERTGVSVETLRTRL